MMPAGKYYVGDICYVLHEVWDEVCDLIGNDGEFTLKDGRRFACYGTVYGDGCYRDQYGSEYGVDAGVIGCIKLEDIDMADLSNFTTGGQIRNFATEFKTGSDNGNIFFGEVLIPTGANDEEE